MRSPFTLYSLNWRQIISFIFVYTELHTGLLGGKQLSLRLRMQLLRDCPCASNGSQSVTQPQALPARRAARSFSGLCWPFALHTMTGWWDVSCGPAVLLSCSWGVWQFLNFVFLSSVGVTNSLLHCCSCEVFMLSHASHQVSLLTLSNHSTVHSSGFACLAFSSPHVSLYSLLPG